MSPCVRIRTPGPPIPWNPPPDRMRPIRFLVPGNVRHNSGGNTCNARLVNGLKALGADIEVVTVEGEWPVASAQERRRLGSLLGAWEPESGPTSAVAVVDGLVAVGAPDELEHAARAGRDTWVLVHMPVPEFSGRDALEREARALRAASGVICTSTSAAHTVAARHGLQDIRIALPGTDPAPEAQGSDPPHLITVAALLPNKDQLLVVDALALIRDLRWTASLVGSDQPDPDYARQIRAAIADHGLDDRIHVPGELTGGLLDDEWSRADLSLLVSRAEAFGLVVTESLARGIPVIVRAGTGAEEPLGLAGLTDDDGRPRVPGAAVSLPPADPDGPGDSAAPAMLAAVLRRWLEEADIRQAWQAAALEARDRLPGWEHTAGTVLAALAGRRRPSRT